MKKQLIEAGRGQVNKTIMPEMAEIVKRIVEASHPSKIIFFGSHAYGKPGKDSDVDLLVIKKNVKSRIEEFVKIRKNLKGIGHHFDIIVIGPEDFEYYSKNWKNSLMSEADSKGIVIYGK